MTSVADTAAQYARLERAADYLAWIRTLAANGGNGLTARAAFEAAHPRSRIIEGLQYKSAVTAGRTDGSSWGSQIAELRPAAEAFIDLTRAKSALGRMTGFRRAPFRSKIPRQTAGALVSWTGQGSPTVVGGLAYDTVTFEESKVSGIVVISKELAKSSDPAAQALINNDLTRATGEFVDLAFLDPTLAPTGDSPGSITYGVTPITATGTTAAALKADLKALVADMVDRGSDLENLYLVMSKVQATGIGLMGEDWTSALGPNGGSLAGIPVITTIADMSEGNSPLTERIVAVDAGQVLLADDGVSIAISEQSTLQMNTAPDSPETAATEFVPLWQNNLVAAKVVRFIRWEAATAGASGYITGAAYEG